MKNQKRYKLAAVMGLISMCLFCVGCSEPPKTYTISRLSLDGETVQQWRGATIQRARTGWVKFTVGGKEVMIDGPHLWEEE